jgi:hypothetical protein
MSINDDPTFDTLVVNALHDIDLIVTAMHTISPPSPLIVLPPSRT